MNRERATPSIIASRYEVAYMDDECMIDTIDWVRLKTEALAMLIRRVEKDAARGGYKRGCVIDNMARRGAVWIWEYTAGQGYVVEAEVKEWAKP